MYAVLGGSVAQLINAVQGNCKTRYVYEKEVNNPRPLQHSRLSVFEGLDHVVRPLPAVPLTLCQV